MRKLALVALCLAVADRAVAQSQNPCEDAELRRLKSLPRASLTESERKAFDRLATECEKFKSKSETKTMSQPTSAETIRLPSPKDSVAMVAQDEPFATPRNFAILGAIAAVVAGIIVAVGSIAESPF